MAKRVEVKTELTTEELHERSRKATNPGERTHWHMVWLMKEGHTATEVAERIGSSTRWVRTIVGRYHQAGEEAISDHRRSLPGASPWLTAAQHKELDQALQERPDDGGFWSGPKVAWWMQDKIGRPVDGRRGWDYLQPLGYSTHVPRPQHEESSPPEQPAFKTTARRGQADSSSLSNSSGGPVEER